MVIYNRSLFGLTILSILFILAGCGRSLKIKYQPKKLYDLNAFSADDFKKQHDVTVFVKQFDRDDCTYYFNSTLSRLVPIEITIINQSDKPMVFNPDHMNMSLASYRLIKKDIRPSYWRSCGIFALGPIIGGTIAAAIYHIVPVAVIGGILSIAAVSTSIYKGSTNAAKHARNLSHARELALANVQEKIIQQAITIHSGNTFSCLLFIKKKEVKKERKFA